MKNYLIPANTKKSQLFFGLFNKYDLILFGTGIGISIAANKVKGIMCAKINSEEEAQLAKEHNNANVIALSGDLDTEKALKMVKTFLERKPNKEEKYQRRIDQILSYENER